MSLSALLLFSIQAFEPPIPTAWVGRWEGPALLAGGRRGRIRLELTKGGQIAFTRFGRMDGKPWRDVYRGWLKRDPSGYRFDYEGVTAYGRGSRAGIVFGADGSWFLRSLRLDHGVLSGTAGENASQKDPVKWVHFRLRRFRSR